MRGTACLEGVWTEASRDIEGLGWDSTSAGPSSFLGPTGSVRGSLLIVTGGLVSQQTGPPVSVSGVDTLMEVNSSR
jgi:hypothetical protein